MSTKLTSSRFIGRQAQLAELELCYRAATDGHPGVVLIGGDSGIGKTRLVDQATCSYRDALVLRGECLEQGEVELPYAPVIGALRLLVREHDPALQELGAASVRHLSRLLPSLGSLDDRGDGTAVDGQVRLFESLLELLHVLSLRQPVVLLIEDIHWADGSTRSFLAFLAKNLTDERLLVIATYRSDELHRRHPLRPLLADIGRLELCRRLALEPFDRGELAQVLQDILGSEADEPLLERMLTRTDGNPLYVEELLAADLTGRGPAPDSLRDVFLLRTERLTPQARLVAQALSIGSVLDEHAIGRLSGLSGLDLAGALRGAVTERLIVADDDGSFRFRHALLREAVYEDLLPGERSAMHLALAKALAEELESTEVPETAECHADRAAMIAAHYASAGDRRAALRAAVAAGDAAMHVNAYSEAADLAERALELWPHVDGAAEVAGVDRVSLLELAAAATALAGDLRRSEMLADRALGELDSEADPSRYGRVLIRRGRSRWRLNQASEARADAQEALELLSSEHSPELANLLSWIARTEMLRGHYQAAITEGERAREMAEDLGLPGTMAEALNTIGTAHIGRGEVETGEAMLRRAIKLTREQGDFDDLATAYSNLADLLHLVGRTSAALAVVEEAAAAVDPRLRRTYGWLQLTKSVIAFESGDWKTARDATGAPVASLAGTALIFRLLRDAEIAMGDGDEQLARDSLQQAHPLVKVTGEAQWHGLYGSLSAEMSRRNGDLEEAQQAVSAALDELETCTDDVMRIARVTAVGLAVEADRAARARALHDQAGERDARVRAELHLGRLRAAAQEGGPVERAWLASGLAESARAGGSNDPSLWAAAATAWKELGRPYCRAQMLLREAEALAERGDRARASRSAARALGISARLGANWLTGELHGLIARARLDLPADAVMTSQHDDHQPVLEVETPFGLTTRELQVLALLAEGASNKQIGAALYMAEKTASVHVSRILGKLEVRSRTQAAAVAHRLHLTAARPVPPA